MSGLGRICKNCTSLRTWSMIGARGDVGLRLKISRRGYNCVFRCSVWAYISNYVYRMFGTRLFCVVIFILFYHPLFRNSYYIGNFIHTHTHTSCSIYLFPGCFGAEGLSGSSLSIPRGRGKVCLHPTLPRPYK
ncbi:hypothetical protein Hanom_Chr13g01214671 [Helianthus anomalus]